MKTTYDIGNMIMLSGLIFACPMEESDANCPLSQLRKLSVEKRLIEIANYSNREITKVMIAHKTCLMNRSMNMRHLIPELAI
jgi:hypothetical protein